jgi:hypothetical protein
VLSVASVAETWMGMGRDDASGLSVNWGCMLYRVGHLGQDRWHEEAARRLRDARILILRSLPPMSTVLTVELFRPGSRDLR